MIPPDFVPAVPAGTVMACQECGRLALPAWHDCWPFCSEKCEEDHFLREQAEDNLEDPCPE